MKRRELMLLLGGAITSARTARAQQKVVPVIGFFSAGDATVGLTTPFPSGSERNRLGRRTEPDDRIPLGRWSL